MGFLGSSFVVALCIAFLLRIIFIAEWQRSVFSKIYGYGVASILFIHVAINIAMTIGLARYWYSLTFHQLWRVLFMGFHYFTFCLYKFGLLQTTSLTLTTYTWYNEDRFLLYYIALL